MFAININPFPAVDKYICLPKFVSGARLFLCSGFTAVTWIYFYFILNTLPASNKYICPNSSHSLRMRKGVTAIFNTNKNLNNCILWLFSCFAVISCSSHDSKYYSLFHFKCQLQDNGCLDIFYVYCISTSNFGYWFSNFRVFFNCASISRCNTFSFHLLFYILVSNFVMIHFNKFIIL